VLATTGTGGGGGGAAALLEAEARIDAKPPMPPATTISEMMAMMIFRRMCDFSPVKPFNRKWSSFLWSKPSRLSSTLPWWSTFRLSGKEAQFRPWKAMAQRAAEG
jgi:hypothetical protein